MSEISINQQNAFTPADMFQQQAPEITPVVEVLGDVFLPVQTAASVVEQTFTSQSTAVDAMQETSEEVARRSRVRRIGRFMVDLPEKINHALLRSTIAFQQEPVHYAKRTAQIGVMGAEFSPLNEGARYGAAAVAYLATKNPWVSTAAIIGTTFLFEGVSSIVAANLLDSDTANNLVEKFNNFAEKRGISREAKLHGTLKCAVAYLGGAAVVQLVKKREVPEISEQDNRKYGLKASAALSGVVGVQTYLTTNAIAHPEPATIAGAVVGVGSFVGIYQWAKGRLHESDIDKIEAPIE